MSKTSSQPTGCPICWTDSVTRSPYLWSFHAPLHWWPSCEGSNYCRRYSRGSCSLTATTDSECPCSHCRRHFVRTYRCSCPVRSTRCRHHPCRHQLRVGSAGGFVNGEHSSGWFWEWIFEIPAGLRIDLCGWLSLNSHLICVCHCLRTRGWYSCSCKCCIRMCCGLYMMRRCQSDRWPSTSCIPSTDSPICIANTMYKLLRSLHLSAYPYPRRICFSYFLSP